MILSEDEKSQFSERGMLILKSFYDKEAMETIARWLSELEIADVLPEQEAKYYEASEITGKSVLVRIENFMLEGNAELRDVILSPKTKQLLEDVMGEPALLFKDKVNYKLPGVRADLLHQDIAAGWGTYADYFVTIVVAVDPNKIENAAMSIMKSGNFERKLMTEEWQPLSTEDPPFKPEDEYLVFEAEPGDVLLFDCFVPHGSPANRSDERRRNLYLTFNRASAGDQRERYFTDKWKNYPPNRSDEARSKTSFRV
jgi:ectoine hydroxylase-related dioxygenase (phytanoyl-CoA dioxygenase family)